MERETIERRWIERRSMRLDETLVAQQQVVRLQALLEASRRMHSTIDLEEVLRTVLQIVVRELELPAASFTTLDASFGTQPSPENSTLNFPLRDKAGRTFTELAVSVPTGRTLTFDELDFLESLATQAAVAIENARFHRRTVEWQRVESDLASARLVQRSLLPQEMPTIPSYSIAARSDTCYEVGGDYLDILSLPSGKTLFVVADVAGKGLTSALVGTSFRSALRAMANANLPLVDIATRLNALHYAEGEESRRRYVTAFFLGLDPSTHTIEVVNAGHNPAFLCPASGPLRRIDASGTPIGMLPSSYYQQQNFLFESKARLLLYTDGLTEVFQGDEEFGDSRLAEAFQTCPACSAAETLASIWNTLETFSGALQQTDDMTALVLLRTQ